MRTLQTIEPHEGAGAPPAIKSVAFDYSGTYLAYAADKIWSVLVCVFIPLSPPLRPQRSPAVLMS